MIHPEVQGRDLRHLRVGGQAARHRDEARRDQQPVERDDVRLWDLEGPRLPVRAPDGQGQKAMFVHVCSNFVLERMFSNS